MKTTEFLEIIAAAQDGRHKVKGLAYSGGKMRLFGWSRPVVVDMAGLQKTLYTAMGAAIISLLSAVGCLVLELVRGMR